MGPLTWTFILCLLSEQVLSQNGCDDSGEGKYSPYVRVYKKKNGPVIKQLDSTGFMDLRYFSGVTLCINGPAMLYDHVVSSSNTDTSKPPKSDEDGESSNEKVELVMKDMKPKVYHHECFVINRMSKRKRSSKEKFKLTKSMAVIGRKAFGVLLVAAAGDYRQSEFHWFKQKSLGHFIKNDEVILGSSFAMVGTMEHCYIDKKERLRGMIAFSGAKTQKEFCYRNDLPGEGKGPITEALFFQTHLPSTAYSFEPCDSSFRGDSLVNVTSAEIDPINEFDPFSIIDPKHWTLDGSDPIPRKMIDETSTIEKTPNSTMMCENFLTCDLATGNVTCERKNDSRFGDDVKYRLVHKKGAEHPEIIALALPLSECVPLEPEGLRGMEEECPEVDANATQTAACDLLAHALDLEETIPEEIKWKIEILDLISDIYGKICPAFSKDSASTVARLFSFYLTRGASGGKGEEGGGEAGVESTTPAPAEGEENKEGESGKPKASTKQRIVWEFLQDELKTCKLNAKPMRFVWTFEEDEEDLVDAENKPHEKSQERHSSEDTTTVSPDEETTTTSPETTTTTTKPETTTKKEEPTTTEKPSERKKRSRRKKRETDANRPDEGEKTDSKNSDGKENTNKLKGNEKDSKKSDTKKTKEKKNDKKSKPAKKDAKKPAKTHEPTAPNGEANSHVSKRQAKISEKHLRKKEFSKVPIQEIVTVDEDEQRNKLFLGIPQDIKIEGTNEPIFYYEEAAETSYEFNLAIDLHWKIFATVIGYCNTYYKERKAETFPRLYNTYYEDFLESVVTDWKHPTDNEALRALMGEFISEAASIWVDSCLEASYIVSKSPSYRPPRPLTIGRQGLQTNYFDVLPMYSSMTRPELAVGRKK